MKILQITKKATWPANDGEILAIRAVRELMLQCGFEVHTLALGINGYIAPLSGAHQTYEHERVVQHSLKINPFGLVSNYLFSREPYVFSRFHSHAFEKEISKEIETFAPDIIWLESVFLMHYIPILRQWTHAAIVLRTHNLEHEIWENKASQHKYISNKIYFKSMARRLRRLESKMCSQADAYACIAAGEAQFIQKLKPNASILQLPMALCFAEQTKWIKSIENNSLYYIGSLDWQPNTEALMWFVVDVLPLIKRRVPTVTFHVAGKNADKAFERFLLRHHVVFHGEVANAEDFLSKYHISVVPLKAGSGLRIKILEAMKNHKPVVATDKAIQGLPAISGTHFMAANTASEFADAVVQLIHNEEYARSIANNAYNFALQNFSSKILAGQLHDFLIHLATPKK